MKETEVNFDGLAGPTHTYGGLSFGNIASTENRGQVSHPRAAALEGLRKMKLLHDLGVKQAVLPPHDRPHVDTLRAVGFTGSDSQVISAAASKAPELLLAVSSSSSMWAANAATVSPASDTSDGRVHFSPANLITGLHRSIETAQTETTLRRIFADERFFAVHAPLPATMALADEGAANQMRLSNGTEIFVYGTSRSEPAETRFPPRQSREASEAVARRHGVKNPVFLRQNPRAIDAGVFHNDVAATSNGNLIIHHEHAFSAPLHLDATLITITEKELTLEDAVKSYLFNSQLVTLPNSTQALIAPVECSENARARECIARIPADRVEFVETRGSMRNGGGPACLRLRVTFDDEQLGAVSGNVFLSDDLYLELNDWVTRHYRESLTQDDLADPSLLVESRTALDELTRILELGSIYRFQM